MQELPRLHFAKVISFPERAHGKIHPRRVNKNNREIYVFFVLFFDMKSNLCNLFILKCVLITNLSIEHYMEGVIS